MFSCLLDRYLGVELLGNMVKLLCLTFQEANGLVVKLCQNVLPAPSEPWCPDSPPGLGAVCTGLRLQHKGMLTSSLLSRLLEQFHLPAPPLSVTFLPQPTPGKGEHKDVCGCLNLAFSPDGTGAVAVKAAAIFPAEKGFSWGRQKGECCAAKVDFRSGYEKRVMFAACFPGEEWVVLRKCPPSAQLLLGALSTCSGREGRPEALARTQGGWGRGHSLLMV